VKVEESLSKDGWGKKAKDTENKRTRSLGPVVEQLPSKYEALSSIPNTKKKKKKNKSSRCPCSTLSPGILDMVVFAPLCTPLENIHV
jgi:hypothetical protein